MNRRPILFLCTLTLPICAPSLWPKGLKQSRRRHETSSLLLFDLSPVILHLLLHMRRRRRRSIFLTQKVACYRDRQHFTQLSYTRHGWTRANVPTESKLSPWWQAVSWLVAVGGGRSRPWAVPDVGRICVASLSAADSTLRTWASLKGHSWHVMSM